MRADESVVARTLDPQTGEALALPIDALLVDARVLGRVAEVELSWVISNPFERAIVVELELPLGAWTLLDHAIEVGDRPLHDAIVGREEALAFQAAATLAKVEPRDASSFRRSADEVEEVLPGESLTLTLTLVRELESEAGRTTLTLPGPSGCAEFELALRLETGLPLRELDSPTHAIATTSLAGVTHVQHVALREPASASNPGREFEVSWTLAADQPQAALVVDPDGWFALLVEPPMHADPTRAIPRELLWLVDDPDDDPDDAPDDAPESIEALVLRRTIAGLREGDALGHDITHEPERLRIALLPRELPLSTPLGQDTRVFGLASNSASDRHVALVEALPRLGRGGGVVQRPSESELELAERFHDRIALPLLVDLELDGVEGGPLVDLFAGHPLLVKGQLRAPLGPVILRGRDFAGPIELGVRVETTRIESRGLAAIWALDEIDALLGLPGRGRCFDEGRDARALALALEHRLLTPITCAVGVIEEASLPVRASLRQPSCDMTRSFEIDANPTEPFRELDPWKLWNAESG